MRNIFTELFKNGVYKHVGGYLGNLVFDLLCVAVIFVVLSWVLSSVLQGVFYQRLKGAYTALTEKEGFSTNKHALKVVGGVILLLVGYYFGYYMNLSSMTSNLDSIIVIDNVMTTYRLAARLVVVCLVGVFALLIYIAYNIHKRKGVVPEKRQKDFRLVARIICFLSYLVVIAAYVSAAWLLYGTFK